MVCEAERRGSYRLKVFNPEIVYGDGANGQGWGIYGGGCSSLP